MTTTGEEQQPRRSFTEHTPAISSLFYNLMDAFQLLVLSFVLMSTCRCSEAAEPTCKNYDRQSINLLEGEALYFVPYIFESRKLPNETFTWDKNMMWNISPDENDRIHHHGAALFFLNLTTQDSGNYTARHIDQSGMCNNYYLKIEVFKTNYRNNRKLLYPEIRNSDENKMLPCPSLVKKTCTELNGSFTWFKNFTLLRGEHQDHLWIKSATKDHEGIYTCVCTWTHYHKVYNSSASRWLRMQDRASKLEVQFLSPSNMEQFADEGYGTTLNCSVFCGTNLMGTCWARWDVDDMDGYNQTTTTVTEESSQRTISTAILTIDKVSARDFETEFKCSGGNINTKNTVTLRLKRRESVLPLVIGGLCVLVFCMLAAVALKYFIIDLALLFRPYFPLTSRSKDLGMYDAYVICQRENMAKATEDTLCQFVSSVLPSVLEEKCGYRLFIQGRDDTPSEDSLELVEERMNQSRTLMVILTSGSKECTEGCPLSAQDSVAGGFDWQVGLQRALVQGKRNVILIQLGDTGPEGYSNLPHDLQGLIHRNAPMKWPGGSQGAAAWNSRFWKRVRYLMPATPVRKCPQSAIV